MIGHLINQKDLPKGSDQEILLENSSESIDFEQHFDSFDFPLGKLEAKGYGNAQTFGANSHLGDWSGICGGNTDLGDSIFSVANGYDEDN